MTTKKIEGDNLVYISLRSAHLLKIGMEGTKNAPMVKTAIRPIIVWKNSIILTNTKLSSAQATLMERIKSANMGSFALSLITNEISL